MKTDLKKYLLILAFIFVQIIVIIWIANEKTEDFYSKLLLTEFTILLMYIGFKEFKRLP